MYLFFPLFGPLKKKKKAPNKTTVEVQRVQMSTSEFWRNTILTDKEDSNYK